MNGQGKHLYVVSSIQEHDDYVERVFTDKCKAVAYCLRDKWNEDAYSRKMEKFGVTEDEPIEITEQILEGMGFEDIQEVKRLEVQGFSVFALRSKDIENLWRILIKNDSYTVRYLHQLIQAMEISGIKAEELV